MKSCRMLCLCCLLFGFFACPLPSAGQQTGDLSWTERTISEEELLDLERSDPSLDVNSCREILSRLNIKEPYYIRDDIRNGRKLKVPGDFNAFRQWTPLPTRLPAKIRDSKFILVVKGIPFIGWYESGVLVGDSQACIGTAGEDTKAGIYRVEEKDANHESKSYKNENGKPAWMPFSLRIYETVWIHGGNVFGSHCSHGCVILPFDKSETLFDWASTGTPVLVVEKLSDI